MGKQRDKSETTPPPPEGGDAPPNAGGAPPDGAPNTPDAGAPPAAESALDAAKESPPAAPSRPPPQAPKAPPRPAPAPHGMVHGKRYRVGETRRVSVNGVITEIAEGLIVSEDHYGGKAGIDRLRAQGLQLSEVAAK